MNKLVKKLGLAGILAAGLIGSSYSIGYYNGASLAEKRPAQEKIEQKLPEAEFEKEIGRRKRDAEVDKAQDIYDIFLSIKNILELYPIKREFYAFDNLVVNNKNFKGFLSREEHPEFDNYSLKYSIGNTDVKVSFDTPHSYEDFKYVKFLAEERCYTFVSVRQNGLSADVNDENLKKMAEERTLEVIKALKNKDKEDIIKKSLTEEEYREYSERKEEKRQRRELEAAGTEIARKDLDP